MTFPNGISLDLDFLTGTMPGGITFTRASGGTYFDNTGTMQTAASNAPRFDYDPATHAPKGLLIESARVNSIRNSTMVGAVAGTPGTGPTNWSIGIIAGITSQVVGTGTESGIPYIDMRWSGTLTSTGTVGYLRFDQLAAIPALPGQVWDQSGYTRLMAGSTANITSLYYVSLALNSATTQIGGGLGFGVFTPTGAALATQRTVSAPLTAPALTAYLLPQFTFTAAAGAVIDITLRFGGPQFELGGYPTAFIPTTNAAATRAADVAAMPTGAWYSASAGTLAVEFMQSLNTYGGDLAGFFTDLSNLLHVRIGANNASMMGWSGGTLIYAYPAAGTYALNIPQAVAFSYNVAARFTNVSLCGAATGSSTSPIALPAITQLQFSWHRNGTQDGWLRRVRCWPFELPSADLQIATTVPALVRIAARGQGAGWGRVVPQPVAAIAATGRGVGRARGAAQPAVTIAATGRAIGRGRPSLLASAPISATAQGRGSGLGASSLGTRNSPMISVIV